MMNRVSPVLIIIVLFIVILFEGSVISGNNPLSALSLFGNQSSESQIEAYANEILRVCESDRYRPTCYDREIPKLMDSISMEDAFKVTRVVQDNDNEYPYCHVLAHELSAREVIKNPTGWKDVVSRCPSNMCSNGCLHGGFQERFREEVFTAEEVIALKPELESLCEKRENWNPTGLEQASCYHALGHLTQYITGAETDVSAALCDDIARKPDGRDYRQLCYDGVFMQLFQPLEPEDFALILGKEIEKDEVDSFCDQFEGRQKGSCVSESWPLFRSDLLSDPKNLVEFCSRSEKSEEDRCYLALIYVLTAQFSLDVDKIGNYCSGLPDHRKGQCFANAASRMIETDSRNISSATEFCSKVSTDNDKDACFQELIFYSTYNFHAGSKENLELCNGLPEPWKSECQYK